LRLTTARNFEAESIVAPMGASKPVKGELATVVRLPVVASICQAVMLLTSELTA
jgi:hypothetical protein